MAHTELSRTPSGAGNRKTFTISFWVKRGELGAQNILFQVNGGTNNTNYMEMSFNGSNQLLLGGYTSNFLTTNRKFRDTSAWYHIVWRVDTTQSTADDRVRLYVNGIQETSFSTRNNPGQNDDTGANMAAATKIGQTLDGLLAQYIMADGQSYAPTTFGSTDSNGVWVPNASPSVTYGTNGFKLDFKLSGTSADASGFGADSSGQTNHFATSNIATNPNTKDSPANVFATLNNVARSSYVTLTEGNLVVTGNTSANNGNVDGTIAPSAGKWYWEAKYVTAESGGGGVYPNIGVYPVKDSRQPKNGGSSAEAGNFADGASYLPDGRKFRNNTKSSYGDAWSAGDIIQVALDMDNYAVYFGKNGTYQNSGVPTSGSSKTGNAQAWTAAEGAYVPFGSGFQNSVLQFNFGNSPFTIASGNADANGYGNFEYAVPSGYYALCTKNLAQYGG